jgi:hypothetical protein
LRAGAIPEGKTAGFQRSFESVTSNLRVHDLDRARLAPRDAGSARGNIMAITYMFGVDTSDPAGQPALTHAGKLLVGNDKPQFWGRYFNGTNNNDHQYETAENAFLRGLGIPVLCWARQMWAVGDAHAGAAADHAKKNMQGVVDAFGAQYLFDNHIKPILYLDIETDDHDYYVLGQSYYKNWSNRIVQGLTVGGHTITFRPAVYLNLRNSRKSVLALNAACAAGAACDGVWPAHYIHRSETGGPPEDTKPDGSNANVPPPTSDKMKWETEEPAHDPFPPGGQPAHPIPKLGWQYFGDYPKPHGDVDLNMVNPAQEATVKAGLVMPPPA